MGICSQKSSAVRSETIEQTKSGKIQIHCPICEQSYDTHRHKPYIICQNQHKFCLSCLESMSNHMSLKKKEKLQCPFCKAEIRQDMKQTDVGTFKFLQAELGIMNKLPDNQKSLFAFSSIYLPSLHKFITEQVKKGDHNKTIQSIDLLRIKGRMLEEYEVFEMGILDCIKGLKKIYLNKNHIKAIDTTLYTQNRLQLIDLSRNKLSNIKSLINQARGVFEYLKVLRIDSNFIQNLDGIDRFNSLQVISATDNKLKDIVCFAGCPSLLFINVEFNSINSIHLYDNLERLYSLQLFGNQINAHEWESLINFGKWKELRLLTGSVVTQNLVDLYSAHKKIQKKMSSAMLKLIILQMKEGSFENTSEITDNIKDKKQLLSKTRMVQMQSSNYQFFINNKGFVQEIIQHAIRYHPLGVNINFRPHPFNKAVYQEDDNIYTFKKISNNAQAKNYLYSSNVTEKGKSFIAFRTLTTPMTLGICEGNPYQRLIEIDCSSQLFGRAKQNEEVQVFASLSIEENTVLFVCGGTTLRKIVPQRWGDYRFFVNLTEPGSKISIIRNQVAII